MSTKNLRERHLPIGIAATEAAGRIFLNEDGISDNCLLYQNDPRFTYESMLLHILKKGGPKVDRTGTGTWGIHGYQAKYDLANGFPLITTKKIHLKSVIHELLWFLKGESNIKYLKDNKVRIWDEWADENGELGPVYGAQWRKWNGDGITVDQVSQLIEKLQKDPLGRRHIVSAWNVAEIPKMALSPCHILFQCHVMIMSLQERREYYAFLKEAYKQDTHDLYFNIMKMSDDELDECGAPVFKLDLQLYQRSCDVFLGVPFNIASYALLQLMIAQVVNMKPGTFIHDYGDLHIYSDHFDQVVTQLKRAPRDYPIMKLNPNIKDILDFSYNDFTLEKYAPHPEIKAKVSV